VQQLDHNAVPPSPQSDEGGEKANSGAGSSRVALIYTTFPSESEAKKAGRLLVESGFAACVNIFPQITSLYIWDGALQESGEAAMLIKTAKDRSEAVLAEVKRLHPYSLPARLVLAVEGGGADFLGWIVSQSQAAAQS